MTNGSILLRLEMQKGIKSVEKCIALASDAGGSP